MHQLVTGGAGFIGSNYVRWVLANRDDRVTVYDALTYAGNRSTLQEVEERYGPNGRYRFVHADICDPIPLEAAMTGVDAVVHFAAESHVDRSIVGPDAFVVTNTVGTNRVCDTARQLEIPRILHVSTDEVYGSVEVGHSHESDPIDPRSPYSASKAGSDLIARSYFSTYDLPIIITRSSNNFGPWQYPEKVIPLFVTNLLDHRTVPLYGDGLNRRDWLFVEDNCAALDLLLREGVAGDIYNVGGGYELTNRELTEHVLAAVGAGAEMIEYVTDRLGHDRRYSVDCTKVCSLGWSPAHDFERALHATVSWYRDNRWWWEPLKARAVPVR
jgi:dTDP-glucose 4,6-dehydratase